MLKTVRIWGAGAVAAAVVAASVGTAVAVAARPSPHRKPTATASASPSVDVSADNVRAWQHFRLRGTADVPAGSRVILQQQVGGQGWISLPASMNTDAHSTYNMRVALGMKGHNKLRLVDSRMRAVSPVIDVWVR
ncbi:hypothetical protein AB0L59_38910 [Streptomyces sp. NPDC052109]|uniref:hypothetical protein n=1 Tax=Streptomyces sp. NPDC052109 TaxID=3155527 RepID=UPI003448F303